MRARTKTPEPVSYQGVRYEVVAGGKGRGLGQNGGLIAAVNPENGEELWVLKVYEVVYDDDLEADKQDVLITDLSVSRWSHCLKIKNERGERFQVGLATRAVTRK